MSFVEDHKLAANSPRELIWDLLLETKAKLSEQSKATRRLVSLNEANEVARRLAATNVSAREADRELDSDDEEEEANNSDEVRLYLRNARLS